MDIRTIPTGMLVFYFVLYGCLPLWVVMGFVDYLCHKASHIERSTGVKESLMHAAMGVQVGIPIFLGLLFEINVLLLLLNFGVLVFHELVAHHDVKYARDKRPISMAEVHAHSFLEVIPFIIVGLVICMNWPAFIDLITLHWSGQMWLGPKKEPINTVFLTTYITLMLSLGVAPYIEELLRCWRYQKAAGGPS